MAPEMVDPDHSVGAAEIAERLGVAHAETVHNWRRQFPDFPQPVATLKQTRSSPAVERWAKAAGRP